ncbi:MAG: monovalent cation:proton antiporter-2 (CPA2) family protein [Dongiaceae bacterium]
MEAAVEHGSTVSQALILLMTAVVAVWLFHRLRISPILGYLAGGAVIGPYGFAVIEDVEAIRGLAEFGVVFLLFTIGLELSFRRLWVMRRLVFGLGGTQVMICSIAIGVAAYFFDVGRDAAIVIGGALALSSTALVLQVLIDRGELADRYGRASFAVLLFQDLAVIPLLVLVPLLGQSDGNLFALFGAIGAAIVQTAVVVAIVILAGRYLLRPIFRQIADTRNAELFVAAILLIVLGIGFGTAQAGLSMSLGAFLAGLLLAEGPYRHQIEADIRPFRGLLLGLFFMTVGTLIDARAMIDQAPVVLGLLAAIILGKAIIVAVLARVFGVSVSDSMRAAMALANCGEFAFVILGLAVTVGLIDSTLLALLSLIVALSMIFPPILTAVGARVAKLYRQRQDSGITPLAQGTEDLRDHFVIAGFGRSGQIAAQLFEAAQIRWIALDLNAEQVNLAHRTGMPVYFGDGTQRNVLEAAGIGYAKALVVTLDNAGAAERTVETARRLRSDLPIATRARDHRQAQRLLDKGAAIVIPEVVEASLQLALEILRLTDRNVDEFDGLVDRIRREGGLLVEPPADDEH